MKNLYPLFIGILLCCFACSSTPNYYGKWRCDRTGVVQGKGEPDHPIAEFYEIFDDFEPIQFEFMKDGNLKFYDAFNKRTKANDTIITIPYEAIEYEDEIELFSSMNGDVLSLVLTNIEKNTMKVAMDADGDGEIILQMNMNRIH